MLHKILQLEPLINLALYRSVYLETYIGAEVLSASSVEEAISILKDNAEQIDYIICREPVRDESWVQKVIQHMVDIELEKPVLVLGEIETERPSVKYLVDGHNIKYVIRTLAKDLNVTAKQMVSLDVPDYYPVSIHLFTGLVDNICDVFQKLGEDYYEMVKDADHAFTLPELQGLRDGGIDTLYIPADQRLNFVNSLNEQLIKKLSDKKLSTKEKMILSSKVQEIVHENIREIGVTDETAKLALAGMDCMNNMVEDIPTLKALLMNLEAAQTSFRYTHCLLTNFLCFHIVSKMEWGNQDQSSKLSLVSFFHDIALNADELCQIHSDYELEQADLPEKQHQIVEKHALQAAKLLQQFPEMPLGVDLIIKQHHGTRSGIGLTMNTQSISPLALVFIVAEEWTHKVLMAQKEGVELARDNAIGHLKRKFNKSVFKKVITSLDKLEI